MDSVDRCNGRKPREKAGNRSAAEKLLAKRHTQRLEGLKLPENLRMKAISFQELCEDALIHSQAENSGKQTYELRLRISQILPALGYVLPIPSGRTKLSHG